MKRTVIQIARIRLGDVEAGDVINLRPDAEHGWFPVKMIRRLPSGDLVATGENTADNVKATPWDLVGIQVAKQVDIPAPSRVVEEPTGRMDVPLQGDDNNAAAERVPAASPS